MFGVGWTEMLLIGVVALIVIGPKDMPVVMKQLGKMVGTIRRLGSEFQRELNKTTGLDQITDLRRSITEPLKQTAAEITREFNRVASDGSVAPSGAIAPKGLDGNSIVAEIHEKAGMSPIDAGPATAPVMTPLAPAVLAKPVESPAPVEAIAPVVKPVRKPRAKKAPSAAPAPVVAVVPVVAAAATPVPARKRAVARKRTPKPKAEA